MEEAEQATCRPGLPPSEEQKGCRKRHPRIRRYPQVIEQLKFFRHADIRSIMHLDSTIGTGITRVIKDFIDFRVAFIRGQLTGVEITVLLRVGTALFSHGQTPSLVFFKDNLPGSNSQLHDATRE